jgi:hypothetical protein
LTSGEAHALPTIGKLWMLKPPHRERSGYGIGGRIETALGILGVSYALGQGDTFMTDRIHSGLVNDF